MTKTYTDACGEVWEKLSAINVNDHVEKKNGLSYLSWAWAYQTMMQQYPNFTYEFLPATIHPDDSVTVSCVVGVKVGDHLVSKTMWLPVMNYANKAIANPSSVDRNNSNMRVLTKAISMLGLGAYIYAGEDLPQEPKGATPDKPAPSGTKAVTKKKVTKKVAAKAAPTPPDQANVTYADDDVPDDDPFNEESGIVIKDELSAVYAANEMITIAKDFESGSVGALNDFWRKNKAVLDILKGSYNEDFLRVKSAFTTLKNKLQEAQE